jgi:hypothetical protein
MITPIALMSADLIREKLHKLNVKWNEIDFCLDLDFCQIQPFSGNSYTLLPS